MKFKGQDVNAADIADYEQHLHATLEALREFAHELIAEHGDNMQATMHLSAAITEEAIRSEARLRGTGFAGLSGLIAHYILKEVRGKKGV